MSPDCFTETAQHVAAEMARQAMRAALNGGAGAAARSYMTDSGSLFVHAAYDGDSVVTSWEVDGRPLSRAAAESAIAARLAARMGGL